ncbi:MAG TPA: class I SAM-dependent methyltransferase, partial [bacterium]|nr:class I SAM-dependent methyltransferase [bacterium]
KAQALKVLLEIRRVLKKTGKLYISVKKGEGEGYDERGRFFAYYSEAEIANILNHADYKIIECSVDESADNRNIKWIYAIAQKI